MGHLVEWSWIVARRGIDVADWFRREGVDTYEKAQNLASKSGFTSPTREQFEKAIAGPRVVQGTSSDPAPSARNPRSVPKKRRRNTKKKRTTAGSITAVEAIEKSKKVDAQKAAENSEAAEFFRNKGSNGKK